MMDFTSTQARAKEVAPPASREEGQTEAAAAKPLSASPPLTFDGVGKMYRQLAKIHAIAAAQLAECTHWCRSNPVSSLVQDGVGRQRQAAMPSTTVLALSPPTNFSSQAPLWR
jgi:hypothetical protein